MTARSVADAVVPERRPGEVFTAYLERIARANGWLPVGERAKPAKAIPAGTRLPYREAGDDSDDE